MLDTQELNRLTARDILQVCGSLRFAVPSTARQHKAQLLDLIVTRAPTAVLSALRNLIDQNNEKNRLKRKAHDADLEPFNTTHLPVTRRISYDYETIPHRDEYKSAQFLDLPTSQETQYSYRQFYEATSNAAVCMSVCGVCAREVGWKEDQVKQFRLDQLPNVHRLIPASSHSSHSLFDGKLLEPLGVTYHDDSYFVHICRQCWSCLHRTTPNLPPPLSLANNMWIGPMPYVLSSLSFPEQLLISHLYPRVFVFKLYPKNGYGGDPDTLQRGMSGTVSTFELDLAGITSMIEGNLMPRPLPLLASVLSVTFIGLGRLPKHWLRQLFRVRRQKVFQALQWLKENNPKYYGDIDINPDRLRALPIDDIPVEILGIIRQSKDVDIIQQESAGYVPTEFVETPQGVVENDNMDIGAFFFEFF